MIARGCCWASPPAWLVGCRCCSHQRVAWRPLCVFCACCWSFGPGVLCPAAGCERGVGCCCGGCFSGLPGFSFRAAACVSLLLASALLGWLLLWCLGTLPRCRWLLFATPLGALTRCCLGLLLWVSCSRGVGLLLRSLGALTRFGWLWSFAGLLKALLRCCLRCLLCGLRGRRIRAVCCRCCWELSVPAAARCGCSGTLPRCCCRSFLRVVCWLRLWLGQWCCR